MEHRLLDRGWPIVILVAPISMFFIVTTLVLKRLCRVYSKCEVERHITIVYSKLTRSDMQGLVSLLPDFFTANIPSQSDGRVAIIIESPRCNYQSTVRVEAPLLQNEVPIPGSRPITPIMS